MAKSYAYVGAPSFIGAVEGRLPTPASPEPPMSPRRTSW